jgi:hypothetical protein
MWRCISKPVGAERNHLAELAVGDHSDALGVREHVCAQNVGWGFSDARAARLRPGKVNRR